MLHLTKKKKSLIFLTSLTSLLILVGIGCDIEEPTPPAENISVKVSLVDENGAPFLSNTLKYNDQETAQSDALTSEFSFVAPGGVTGATDFSILGHNVKDSFYSGQLSNGIMARGIY